jgi:hypothetical protein
VEAASHLTVAATTPPPLPAPNHTRQLHNVPVAGRRAAALAHVARATDPIRVFRPFHVANRYSRDFTSLSVTAGIFRLNNFRPNAKHYCSMKPDREFAIQLHTMV